MKKSIQRRRAKERFAVAERIEKEYLRALRQLTRQIDHMTKAMVRPNMSETESLMAYANLERMLRSYSETIAPWAKSLAEKIVARIAKTDEKEWVMLGKDMNRSLNKELNEAPTGNLLRTALSEQVKLITSLPLEAAKRVHDMTLEAMTTGERADNIAKKILETGQVTEARAKSIARTEVARTASGLTEARSKHIGSSHYYWRTSGDGDVRKSHKEMDGKICEWNKPPEVEPGKFYHAGQFPNCRCYPEPILDNELKNARIKNAN